MCMHTLAHRECKLDATDGSVVALLYQDNTLVIFYIYINILMDNTFIMINS